MSRILEQYTSAGGVGVNTVKKMAQVRNAVKQMRVMWPSLRRRPVSFLLHLAAGAAAMAAGGRAQTAAIAPPVLILTVLLISPLIPLPDCPLTDGGPIHKGVAGDHGGRARISRGGSSLSYSWHRPD